MFVFCICFQTVGYVWTMCARCEGNAIKQFENDSLSIRNHLTHVFTLTLYVKDDYLLKDNYACIEIAVTFLVVKFVIEMVITRHH